MEKNAAIDISYVAQLARIELTPQEKEKFAAQLGQIALLALAPTALIQLAKLAAGR